MPGEDRHAVFRLIYQPHKFARHRCRVVDKVRDAQLGRPVWIGHQDRVAVHRLHDHAAQRRQTDRNVAEQDGRQVLRQRLAH